MALVLPADVRAHFETDLSDAALQRLIDDADQLIVKRFGPHASSGAINVEVFSEFSDVLYLTRPIAAVTSVTETKINGTQTALVPADYRIELGGSRLRRSTTPGFWEYRVNILYTPVSDDKLRTRIELDLVKLAARYNAARTENVGDYAATEVDYEAERENLVAPLVPFGL